MVQDLDYQDRMTPDLRQLAFRFRSDESSNDVLFADGVYKRMVLDLYLDRPVGYYLWEVYMPATFIVVMSFTSFWLDRAATPARVRYGLFTNFDARCVVAEKNFNRVYFRLFTAWA